MESKSSEHQEKGKVLIIEDDERWKDILSGILGFGGYEVTIASTPSEAEEILQQAEFFNLVTVELAVLADDGSRRMMLPSGGKVSNFMKNLCRFRSIPKIPTVDIVWPTERTLYPSVDVFHKSSSSEHPVSSILVISHYYNDVALQTAYQPYVLAALGKPFQADHFLKYVDAIVTATKQVSAYP